MAITVHHGDCLDVLATMPEASVDCCVTDPPYHLIQGSRGRSPRVDGSGPYGRHKEGSRGFMGKTWDGGDIAMRPETWAEVLRVLKPGGHLIALCGTRTEHRVACAIEDAGFEIRDRVLWIYAAGFPKSHNLSGEWQGWGTALKPAVEIGVLARKPLSEPTIAANVLRWGTGAINVDGCRIPLEDSVGVFRTAASNQIGGNGIYGGANGVRTAPASTPENSCRHNLAGRWPANLLHDGSDEVLEAFAAFGENDSRPGRTAGWSLGYGGGGSRLAGTIRNVMHRDTGTAARFFFSGKATAAERGDSKHPTVKPLALMRYLVRLVCPPGGVVLDPFAGSGTTGEAAFHEGFSAILIEREEAYVADIRARMARARGPLFAGSAE